MECDDTAGAGSWAELVAGAKHRPGTGDWDFAYEICELLNSFEDDSELFLTEHDRKWLKAMDHAFSGKVQYA